MNSVDYCCKLQAFWAFPVCLQPPQSSTGITNVFDCAWLYTDFGNLNLIFMLVWQVFYPPNYLPTVLALSFCMLWRFVMRIGLVKSWMFNIQAEFSGQRGCWEEARRCRKKLDRHRMSWTQKKPWTSCQPTFSLPCLMTAFVQTFVHSSHFLNLRSFWRQFIFWIGSSQLPMCLAF